MGMSSTEWSRYMRDQLGVPMEPDEISAAVVERLKAEYRRRVPLLPDAVETVRALAQRWPLALASSANRPLIDLVLELTGMAGALPGNGLLRGGAARKACAGRLHRGGSAAGSRSGAVRRGRGLHQRDPLGERRRDAGGRGPAAGLPAIGRSPGRRGRGPRLPGRARGGAGASWPEDGPGTETSALRRRAPARARPRGVASASRRSRAWPRRRRGTGSGSGSRGRRSAPPSAGSRRH